MISYQSLFEQLPCVNLQDWPQLQSQLDYVFNSNRYGDLPRWQSALEQLPDIRPSCIELSNDVVTIGQESDAAPEIRQRLEQQLRQLHPWRKGPFSLFGIYIDTEWRSDWKWQRLQPHISPLQGRQILDVGCGSGYHLWRMWAQDAAFILGIDPSPLYVHQFYAIKHYVGDCNVHLLPVGIEHMPPASRGFDTVFSMGVLYHRRSPIDHLYELRDCLRAGGELVLETLVVDETYADVLVPVDRYAKMRNVWFIPSVALLQRWLQRAGFQDIRLVDVTTTTVKEQRSTDWMRFESLADFLATDDPAKTIEGYPAPVRAVVVAQAP